MFLKLKEFGGILFRSEEPASLSIVRVGPYLVVYWFVYRRLLIIFLGLYNFLVPLFGLISGQGAAFSKCIGGLHCYLLGLDCWF